MLDTGIITEKNTNCWPHQAYILIKNKKKKNTGNRIIKDCESQCYVIKINKQVEVPISSMAESGNISPRKLYLHCCLVDKKILKIETE
jgi:hypothetical protein